MHTPIFLRAALATFAVFLTFGMLVLALPLYVKDSLGRGEVGVGIAMGAASITAIVFGAVSGRIADRRGRRIVVAGGAAIMVVAYLALALSPPLWAIAAIRLLAGIGEAAFVVAAYTVVTDIAPSERRGEATSLATLASYSGLAIGPLVGDVVLGDGRFGVVWLLAAVGAGLAMLIALTLPETRPETRAPAGWLPPRAALLPGLVLLLALLGFGGFNAFVALHAREIGFARPGLVFGLFAVVVLVVRGLGRKLPDRLGGRRAAVVACTLLAAGLAVMGAVPTSVGLVAGTILFGAGQSLAFPAVTLIAMARASEAERSAVIGSVTAFVDVALAFGAFALGAVAALSGYGGAFLTASAVAVAALVLVLSRLRPPPEAPPIRPP